MDPPLPEYHIGILASFVGVGSPMDAGMEDDYMSIKQARDAVTRVDDNFVKNSRRLSMLIDIFSPKQRRKVRVLCNFLAFPSSLCMKLIFGGLT